MTTGDGTPIWEKEPYRIGVLIDAAMGTPPVRHWANAMRLALDCALEDGLISKPVELVEREVNGLPYGRFSNVLDAWDDLVHQEQVLAVAGPWYSDNALTLHDTIERDRVPSLSMASTLRWSGEYCFAFQNGAPPEDAALLADWIHASGYGTVGIVHEDNDFGNEYYVHFRNQCRRHGTRIAGDQVKSTFSGTSLRDQLESVRDAKPEVFLYVGYGVEGNRLFREVRAMEWDVPKLVGSSFMGASTPDYGYGLTLPDIEGWVGVDQFDPRNPRTQMLLDLYEARFAERPAHAYVTHGWDWGNTLAEALATVHPANPQQFKLALEQVRNLPAATGSEGTYISFGPYDHRAYRGSRWVSLSRCLGGRIEKID